MKTGDYFESVSDVKQNLRPNQGVVVRHTEGKVIIHGEPRVPGHPVGSENLTEWLQEAKKRWPDQEVEVVYEINSTKIGECGGFRIPA